MDARDQAKAAALARDLAQVAGELHRKLELVNGAPVPFVLIVDLAGHAQYVSNVPRPRGRALIDDQLRAWPTVGNVARIIQ